MWAYLDGHIQAVKTALGQALVSYAEATSGGQFRIGGNASVMVRARVSAASWVSDLLSNHAALLRLSPGRNNSDC
jgi:hypothetical protein